MTIRLACPACHRNLSAPDEKAGSTARCPACRSPFTIPVPPAPAAPPPVAIFLSSTPSKPPAVIPTAVVPPAFPDVVPAGPPTDPTGRFILSECEQCERPLHIPINREGSIQKCPSCFYFFRTPGRLPQHDPGVPMQITVSGRVFSWPLACSCCLGAHDAVRVPATPPDLLGSFFGGLVGKSAASPVDAPYCWACLDHCGRAKRELCTPTCSAVGPAVLSYGHHGTVWKLGFTNIKYVNQFIKNNKKKMRM